MRPVQREGGWRVGSIKLCFLKDSQSTRRKDGVRRKAKFLEILNLIAQKPAADVDGSGAYVQQLDLILQRRQTVRENLIDDHRSLRQIIRGLRRCAPGKAYDIGAAIKDTALGDIGDLGTEGN